MFFFLLLICLTSLRPAKKTSRWEGNAVPLPTALKKLHSKKGEKMEIHNFFFSLPFLIMSKVESIGRMHVSQAMESTVLITTYRMWGVFPGCTTIQLNSDNIYIEIASDPTG